MYTCKIEKRCNQSIHVCHINKIKIYNINKDLLEWSNDFNKLYKLVFFILAKCFFITKAKKQKKNYRQKNESRILPLALLNTWSIVKIILYDINFFQILIPKRCNSFSTQMTLKEKCFFRSRKRRSINKVMRMNSNTHFLGSDH
jgi:hypothetical protein